MDDYNYLRLPNGIQVVHKEITSTRLVHAGIVLDVGSRDEDTNQLGLAHFWEHMAFKGTSKRKAFHILSRLDSVGGELNAYTTKEKICFYASILDTYIEKAVDIISDITFNSVFPEKQIEKERGVILEEMSMYYDSPEDAIQDDFDEIIFSGHPLGNNILGTRNSVLGFQKKDFQKFISDNMDTSKMVFSIVGNISWKKAQRLADKYLAIQEPKVRVTERVPFGKYIPRHVEVKRNTMQAHCAIGCEAYNIHDDKRLPFFTLTNILGGPAMSSRLNMGIREKYGYVYAIDASYQSFTDTGMFAVFFGTEKRQLKKCISLVYKEIEQLKSKKLGSLQLHKAKGQIMGQLAMAEENNASLMLLMAKSLLDLNRIESLKEIFTKIDQISSDDLLEVSNEILQADNLSLLTFIPERN
ncbi:M16 family metallopeptidase [Marinigracilibium pacificum]|uniref:Insulinase family protein n=1 Tax=Marinigracilibium pacificum TaxID=2729599 RepID=A0A848J2J4_9BACT|nr:pitrilysin family protein [Marinigracilibium pacificum]NMM49548.1 insulinase family protein [Marinigracilibium pacificum]